MKISLSLNLSSRRERGIRLINVDTESLSHAIAGERKGEGAS